MGDIIYKLFTVLLPMIISLTFHECAHAGAAYLLGDNTAKRAGRLTLNPLPHIDLIGTILLPCSAILFSSVGLPFFGWAKPVPVDPRFFDRDKVTMRNGMLLTAAAGPASNILLALICGGVLSVLFHCGVYNNIFFQLFLTLFQINLVLAIFNMIPIYPLDGQKVLSGLLSYEASAKFESFSARYGSMLLIAIIIFGGSIISIPLQLGFHFILGTIFGLPV